MKKNSKFLNLGVCQSPDDVIDNDSLLEYQEKISRIDPSFRNSDGHADEYHDKIIQSVINLLKEKVL